MGNWRSEKRAPYREGTGKREGDETRALIALGASVTLHDYESFFSLLLAALDVKFLATVEFGVKELRACRCLGCGCAAGRPGALRLHCHNATLGRRDFYRHICRALAIESKATAASVFWELSNHVEQLGREKIHPVLLLDEAQLLSPQVLEHLHILANYAWDQKPLLSLLLALSRIARALAQAQPRGIPLVVVSHPLQDLARATKPEDTVEYVQYRVERVGGKATVFASDALALIHEATVGQLRDVDRVATACLRTAARRKLKHVDRELLQDVFDNDTSPD